jgi:hypothetical protein
MQPELAIAILALITAVLSAYATRVHNRLSVRPMLHISRSFSANTFRIFLRNSGTGPAIIKSVTAILAEHTLDATATSWTRELQEQCANLLAEKQIRAPRVGTARALVAATLEIGGVIGPKEDFVLIRTDERFSSPKAATALYAYLLEHLAFSIRYASIYGERFRYTEPRRS